MELTVGMATYNDVSGVYFTLQALRLYQDLTSTELLVIDNYGDDRLETWISTWCKPNTRYIRSTDIQGTSAPRQKVFEEAKGKWVLCIDSHVLLAPGALGKFREWSLAHPDCLDLLHGPMMYDNITALVTHMNPVWRDHMWGIWADVKEEKDLPVEGFEIPMHGLGLFGCRKDAWLGFNPAFRGFGGEEGYIHEKFKQQGRKILCLPFLQWLHRFKDIEAPKFTLDARDRISNYLHGFHELNLPFDDIKKEFGEVVVDKVAELANINIEPTSPLPKVSCLTATYGRVSVLQEALACFLLQDYENKELIILNNHEVPLVFDHPRVRIINEPGHPTLGHCRNRLIQLAEGELVRTWDDDDLYLPWAISQGVANIKNAPAWKPRESWFSRRNSLYMRDENVYEASITFRRDIVLKYGYQESGGDEHHPLLAGIMDHEGGCRKDDARPSYCYRWGTALHRISGSLGSGSIEDRTQAWMQANNDTGNGEPLAPAFDTVKKYYEDIKNAEDRWNNAGV